MAQAPSYAPNVVNQTVSNDGVTWKGNPGSGWTMEGSGGGGGSRLGFVSGLTDQMLSADAAEKTKVDAARGSLVDYYKGLEDPTSRFTRLSKENGVTEQQDLVNSLTRNVMQQQDMYEAIPESVRARSGDFMINDADKTAITANEQQPVLENLNKLLRNKQYEEIGLAGKQQLVSQLLELSFKGDEMGAKPLQLGVDYTEEDRAIARDLFTSVLSAQSGAFSADQDSRDADRRAEESRAFEETMFGKQTDASSAARREGYAHDTDMNKLDFAQQLALKSASGSGTDSKLKAQMTEDAWNEIMSGSKTEYDVWWGVKNRAQELAAKGVDVSKLWSMHKALAGKVGTGGEIRKSASDSDL